MVIRKVGPGAPIQIPQDPSTPAPVAPRKTSKVDQPAESSLTASVYDLVPNYPAVSLPSVLAQAPLKKELASQILDAISQKSGIQFSPERKADLLRKVGKGDVNALTNALVTTPQAMAAAIHGINVASQQGKLKPSEPAKFILPELVNFTDLRTLEFHLEKASPKEVLKGSGLYTGDIPSEKSVQEIRRNKAISEVFQRLSMNQNLAPGKQRFEVEFNNKRYSNFDDFVKALKKNGYSVDVSFESRSANFANLKTIKPNSNPPEYIDVPAPLMLKTPVGGEREVTLPAIHSEMVIRIKDKEGELVGSTRFFQGVSGAGFFPADEFKVPEWCGLTTQSAPKNKDKDGFSALSMAGTLASVIQGAAKENKLYADGYGVTGVCNDSVAVIMQTLGMKQMPYPLLMNDNVLSKTIDARLTDADKRDDKMLKAIKEAIAKIPSDDTPQPDAPARLRTLPWTRKTAPFISTLEAMDALGIS